MVRACLLTIALASPTAPVDAPDAEPRKAAETYLNAISGAGAESGRDLLLGGATLNAKLFTLENWRIVGKEPVRKEEGDLVAANQAMHELDMAGRKALNELLAQVPAESVVQVSAAQATRLLAPTKEKADAFLKGHPVLAYVARVGKEVYWHPKNPLRALLARAPESGPYSLELHLWNVETREGPQKVKRVWPLRVLRFKAGKMDTGWKVLPASDWNAE